MAEQTSLQKAQAFLSEGEKYRLGVLPTEQSNSKTVKLSDLANENLKKAYGVLKEVDHDAVTKLLSYADSLLRLKTAVSETLRDGGRIFLVGCGATGRLSLSLEYFFRRQFSGTPYEDRLVSFMAGGDVALVHALEGFEDFPQYGARQLEMLGFSKNDLLIASTEGGETPFVIGATLRAAELSQRKPFFVFCNPKEILVKHVERSRQVLNHPGVLAVELFVGPMALSGSTRMQASTVLMLGIATALLEWKSPHSPRDCVQKFIQLLERTDFTGLATLTEKESELAKNQANLIYQTSDFGITVFTDTTERAPTFNLPAFDNQNFTKANPSLCYIVLTAARDGAESWRRLLGREPRCLNWQDINTKTSPQYLSGFDFSPKAVGFRESLTHKKPVYFSITRVSEGTKLELEGKMAVLPSSPDGEFYDHLLLKLALNMHSTLLMGRLHRFEGNFMTWVYPTNGKLIDRATRYTMMLLERRGIKKFSYEDVVVQLFAELESLSPNESVVFKTAATLAKNI